MKQTIMSIDNHHVESCGIPPVINADEWDYIGYFENEYGEQFIFLSKDDESFLYCGDAGWDTLYKIEEYGDVPGLTMHNCELIWVVNCWVARFGDYGDRKITFSKAFDEVNKKVNNRWKQALDKFRNQQDE